MALPLPKVVSDVGPGGGIVTAMGGINSLANDMLLRQMNDIKKQYLPATMQAEAASKLAYANLMGPQFMAKLLGNDSAIANMGDANAKAALQQAMSAGMGGGSGQNILNQMQQNRHPTGIGQPGTNSLSGWFADKLKNSFGQNANPLASPSAMPQQQTNPLANPSYQGMPQGNDGADPESANNPEVWDAFDEWSKSPEGKAQIAKNDGMAYMPAENDLLDWYRNKKAGINSPLSTANKNPMQMELNKGQKQPTYAENAGTYKGTIKQKETEGKYRADALNAIGQSQLGLSNSGAVLDRMTGIIKNPTFANMRNTIPGFQNKQLDYLKVMGTPEQKELIGDFLSTGESFIASTVQGFSGKPLVREFDLAQRQKITGHDTIESATGKLRSARALHDIAEQKNEIVSKLLQNGYSEADAVKQANKMVDVSAIEKATNNLLQRKVEIKNSKTGEKKMVTIEEARKLGVPNV